MSIQSVWQLSTFLFGTTLPLHYIQQYPDPVVIMTTFNLLKPNLRPLLHLPAWMLSVGQNIRPPIMTHSCWRRGGRGIARIWQHSCCILPPFTHAIIPQKHPAQSVEVSGLKSQIGCPSCSLGTVRWGGNNGTHCVATHSCCRLGRDITMICQHSLDILSLSPINPYCHAAE